MTWDEAMVSPHKQEFMDAAQREMDELAEKGTWYEDLKSNATTKIVPSKWVSQVTDPSGSLKEGFAFEEISRKTTETQTSVQWQRGQQYGAS